MKMKKAFMLILTFTVLLLTGCSAVDAKLEQALMGWGKANICDTFEKLRLQL